MTKKQEANILSKAFERSAEQLSLSETETKIIAAIKPIAAQFGKFLFEATESRSTACLWLSAKDRINLVAKEENTASLPEGRFNSVMLTLTQQSQSSIVAEHPFGIRIGINRNGGGEYTLVDLHGETVFRTGKPRELIQEFLRKTDEKLRSDILKHGAVHHTLDEIERFRNASPKQRPDIVQSLDAQ